MGDFTDYEARGARECLDFVYSGAALRGFVYIHRLARGVLCIFHALAALLVQGVMEEDVEVAAVDYAEAFAGDGEDGDVGGEGGVEVGGAPCVGVEEEDVAEGAAAEVLWRPRGAQAEPAEVAAPSVVAVFFGFGGGAPYYDGVAAVDVVEEADVGAQEASAVVARAVDDDDAALHGAVAHAFEGRYDALFVSVEFSAEVSFEL